MRTVTVDKKKLIAKLQENLEIHKREFVEAMIGYWATFEHQLKMMQEQVARRDLTVTHAVAMAPRPTSHVDDYERAIKMLEWELDGEVTLSVNDFQCYVMDSWDWQPNFKSMHSTYTSSR